MALNKQKLLSELGSVVNQLQSADCGCLGKLFGQNQGGAMQPTGNMHSQGGAMQPMGNMPNYGRCNHHCYHNHCSGFGGTQDGNVYSTNTPSPTLQNMQGHCCGNCNPTKLFETTQGYLNNNLVKPVVQDVYNELKSITPANTVMNNPMASQMGLSANNPGNANQMQALQGGNTAGMMNPGSGGQQMSPMAGMGPQIVNMMMGSSGNKPSNNQNGQIQSTNMQGQAVNNPMSGMAPNNPNTQTPQATNQYNTHTAGNMQTVGHTRANMGQNNRMMPNANLAGQSNYGKHTEGISKFNQMFPGVMTGDLGFDPMAIAIQMNPANQQQVAMNTMQKLMTGDNSHKLQNLTNSGAMSLGQAQDKPAAQSQQGAMPNNVPQNQQGAMANTIAQNQQGAMPNTILQGQEGANGQHEAIPNIIPQSQQGAMPNTIPQSQQGAMPITIPQSQQGVVPNNIQPQQGMPNQLLQPQSQQGQIPQSQYQVGYGQVNQQPYQQYNTPQNNAEMPNQSIQPQTQEMIKEPLYPADISKNLYYNPLGQPVQMIPAKSFHQDIPDLPQTLAPQPSIRSGNDKYSNVKSTMSKTSLTGPKAIGRTPSRTHMQNLYNQYKGSQSFTQQNVIPEHGGTFSEGKLNIRQAPVRSQSANESPRAPTQMVVGDSVANTNDQVNNQILLPQETGDMPTSNKPQGDGAEKANPEPMKKGRNGLQDMVFPNYAAASWTFHGDSRVPYQKSHRAYA